MGHVEEENDAEWEAYHQESVEEAYQAGWSAAQNSSANDWYDENGPIPPTHTYDEEGEMIAEESPEYEGLLISMKQLRARMSQMGTARGLVRGRIDGMLEEQDSRCGVVEPADGGGQRERRCWAEGWRQALLPSWVFGSSRRRLPKSEQGERAARREGYVQGLGRQEQCQVGDEPGEVGVGLLLQRRGRQATLGSDGDGHDGRDLLGCVVEEFGDGVASLNGGAGHQQLWRHQRDDLGGADVNVGGYGGPHRVVGANCSETTTIRTAGEASAGEGHVPMTQRGLTAERGEVADTRRLDGEPHRRGVLRCAG